MIIVSEHEGDYRQTLSLESSKIRLIEKQELRHPQNTDTTLVCDKI